MAYKFRKNQSFDEYFALRPGEYEASWGQLKGIKEKEEAIGRKFHPTLSKIFHTNIYTKIKRK